MYTDTDPRGGSWGGFMTSRNAALSSMGLGVLTVLCGAWLPASAQWFDVRTPGIPRLPDGSANLSAPAPKTHDGKPDLSGIWKPSPPYIGNLASDLKPGDAPFQPWALELFQQRRAT